MFALGQFTYFSGFEHLPGWYLLAQVCQGRQQVVLALIWQLQDGLEAHDVLNNNHPLQENTITMRLI